MPQSASKKTSRLTLFAFLAILVAIILAYFGALPLYRAFKKASFDVAVKRQEISKGRQRIDEVNQAYAKLRTLKRDIELLDVAVPAEPAVPEALIQLNEIVNRSGLQINAITPAGEEESTSGELQITLAVQGPFRGLQEFVGLSEKNLRPIKIKSLNILSQEGEGGLSGNFQLSLVYGVEEKPKTEEAPMGPIEKEAEIPGGETK